MDQYQLLLESLYEKYQYDFRGYSRESLKRRINKATSLLECDSLPVLQDKFLSDPVFADRVLDVLTVPVSEMFRDPVFFLSIRKHIIPALRAYPSLKIWIAGCSTGEEVYSFAILLREEGLLDQTIIYATDINAKNLGQADAGIFKLDKMQKFTSNYYKAGGTAEFSDYYSADYDEAVFNKSLKRNVVFSDHSLSTDAVFSETQLVSCRNVLMYFAGELQEKAIGLFHESLSSNGFLGLGPGDTIKYTKYANAFLPVIEKDCIFQKKEKL